MSEQPPTLPVSRKGTDELLRYGWKLRRMTAALADLAAEVRLQAEAAVQASRDRQARRGARPARVCAGCPGRPSAAVAR
jgi:TPP-dependent indolepyruvate ferredoxin oxidoreductase alpha subunit